ncbi:MAG: protein-L-isoaspartate O-methyltransferase, partial [Candidatus Omnitrophica bacterium]|nr:protein-L-isoaspartate O-methyltransferase [Candidatus Omnitrophota bacterium]
MTRLNRIFLIITVLFLLGADYSKEISYARKENMVNSQIKVRGVTDERVLKAMGKVERHLFVPLTDRHLSYEDYPLP